MWATAAQLAPDIGPEDVVIGYSMGGRAAIHLALTRPLAALILISASPGLADPEERALRRQADSRLAERILQIGSAKFATEWLELPMFATLPATARFERERAANPPSGLAGSLRLAGTGAQDSLWDRLGELRAPTLVVTGGFDAKFGVIGRRMVDRIPNSELVVVSEAGHSAHLERPEATASVIGEFLDRIGPV
jgi:2-succinyl-6-hydroxy-2,4-cyclohexadiene-1-carboxylate synthase